MTFQQWVARWGVSYQALRELEEIMCPASTGTMGCDSEAGVSNAVRLEAARKSYRLWRNNVGALQDVTGRWVRYGLANDSVQLNKVVKSADLIGIKPHTVVPSDVGLRIGIFLSREVKAPGWEFNPNDERDIAQRQWCMLVNSMGGDAAIVTGVGSL